jgi:uncharacterized membrane protein
MNANILLITGLVIFLGTHSVRIVADEYRTALIARMGLLGWKGLIAVLSLLGFVLLVYGYGAARAEPVMLWSPPPWTKHLTALLTLPAFILFVAAYVPGNKFKSAIGHPLIAGTKVWALGHLLANGTLANLLLFGSFLVWAAFQFSISRRRDRAEGRSYPAGPASRTAITIVVGIVAWGLFAKFLHFPLIGVQPY